MRPLRIILAVLFVLTVSVLVIRGCVRQKPLFLKLPSVTTASVRPEVLRDTPPAMVTAPAVGPGAPLLAARPRLAIILDDWGYDLSLVKEVAAIQRPVTLSVLPALPHSAQIAEEAHRRGLGVMLHMPMQPKDPKKRLEPHTIMTTSTEAEIRQYLDEALKSVPYAQGCNNHMGSAATSDPRVMRVFLSELKKKDLFFVDSNVIPTTSGPWMAKSLGIPFTKRDLFIDNQMNKAAIVKQLKKAGKAALAQGRVVVIGHDHAATVKAIASTMPVFEKSGIELVLVRDLLEKN